MRNVFIKCIAFMLLLALAGCKGNKAAEELAKWQVNLQHDDKRPYGTYLAYESLKYYFPGAAITALPAGFRYTNMDADMRGKMPDGQRSLLVLQGLDFFVSAEEWVALKDYMARGNALLIFCSSLDPKIEKDITYTKQLTGEEDMPIAGIGSQLITQQAITLADDAARAYTYKGRSLKGYFFQKAVDVSKAVADSDINHVSNDSPEGGDITEDDDEQDDDAPITAGELGYVGGKPNFINFGIGKGYLALHAAPLALSNYFLLQPGNKAYLDGVWQTLPEGITKIYWNDYYKRTGQTSGMDVLWRYPATRLALLLAIVALLVYVVFESRRKQRIIPIIAPLRNDSVSFVETVGRLYYNKGNHANLAAKMVQQYLEWVRINYYLNTNLMNEEFIQQLIIKSGQSEGTVRGLMNMITEVKTGTGNIDDAYLYQLYNTIQQFYKNKRS